METYLHDSEFGITQLAEAVGMHRSQMTRAFLAAIHLSPRDYLNSLRLQRVLALLKETAYSITTIAELTGFGDPNYL
ncbi:MAG TPA: helix-turn-helix transcriptional regulator [Armatimonadota bacterium]|nr:helix-turn-helix transcriptional regulator [Armatimonadota bacterium]